MASWPCPDVLGQPDISQYPTPWDTDLPAHQHQKLYCGFPGWPLGTVGPREAPPDPSMVDLESDTVPISMALHVSFDIDSADGLALNLAVAREGFQ